MTIREFIIYKLENMEQAQKPKQTKTLTKYYVVGICRRYIEVPVPKEGSKRFASDLGYALEKLAECYKKDCFDSTCTIIGHLLVEKEEMEKNQ